MGFNLQKLQAIAKPRSEKGIQKAKERAEKRALHKKFANAFEKFKIDNPMWDKYLTDSVYNELMDWYSENYNLKWINDEIGYPNEVYEFSKYIWKQICPQAFEEN